MKLFSWLHKKLNGGGSDHHQTNQHSDHIRTQEQEAGESHDCNSSPLFLSIGTLGNKCPLADHALIHPDDNKKKYDNTSYYLDGDNNNNYDDADLCNFTLEEVGQLQKELKKLFKRKPASKISLDEYLNFPSSSLEMQHRISNKDVGRGGEKKEEVLDGMIKRIIDRSRDVCKERKSGTSIGKRSVSFLIKKMFLCTSGFMLSPSLRNNAPFQESTLMDKLLRTTLSKKIHPQSSSPSQSSIMKRLEEKTSSHSNSKVEEKNDGSGSKWVKTDSEYIVLEI